jgi:AraC-like DNA-binding protein
MRAGPRLQSQLVRPLLRLLRERGRDVAAFARRHALPAEAEHDKHVTLGLVELRALLDDGEAELGEPHLGLVLAGRAERGAYDLLEYSCRSAPDLREALRRLARYVRLANDVVELAFVEAREDLPAGWGSIEQRVPGSPLAVATQANEFFAAMVLGRSRELVGRPLRPRHVLFAHAEPADREALATALGTRDLRFGQGRNAVVVDAEFLAAPIASHDPALLAILDRYARRELEQKGGRPEVLVEVRRQIGAALAAGPPALAAVAGALGVTPRTLQRRLAEHQTSFGAEVESVREELARLHVADAALSFGEVAYLLGYADLSGFARAFRRWTAMTPAQYRLRGDTRR